MQIQADNDGNILLLSPSGRLDTITAPDFDEAVNQHLEQGAGHLVLDLAGLEYISSAGLRSMLMLAKKMKAQSGALVLCGLNQMIAEVFEVSGFLALFDTCADRDQALQQVKQAL